MLQASAQFNSLPIDSFTASIVYVAFKNNNNNKWLILVRFVKYKRNAHQIERDR